MGETKNIESPTEMERYTVIMVAAAKSLQSCPTMWPHRRQPTRLGSLNIENVSFLLCHLQLQCSSSKNILYWVFHGMWVLSGFRCVWLFGTLWSRACQAPLSMRFSRQECWSGLLWPPPGDLLDPGIDLTFLAAPAWQAISLLSEPPRKPHGM